MRTAVCCFSSCVQYVKDLFGIASASGTAGLEPVLAAGLDTLIPVLYRFIEQNCRQAGREQEASLSLSLCLYVLLLSFAVP